MLRRLTRLFLPAPVRIDRLKRHKDISAVCLESVLAHLIKHSASTPQTTRQFCEAALRIDLFSCGPFARTFQEACAKESLKGLKLHFFGSHYALYDPVLFLFFDAANPLGYPENEFFKKRHITGLSEDSIFKIVDELESVVFKMAADCPRIAEWLKAQNFQPTAS